MWVLGSELTSLDLHSKHLIDGAISLSQKGGQGRHAGGTEARRDHPLSVGGLKGSCELPNVGARNQTQIFWESSQSS